MMKNILLFGALFGIFLLIFFANQGALPPEPQLPFSSFTGRVAFEQGGVYANPSNSFVIGKDAFAFGEELAPQVSDTIVYKYGYYAKDGGSWQQFTLQGAPAGGNWLLGPAQGTIRIVEGSFGAGENYLLAYACTRENNAWQCHADKWMAHSFQVSAPVQRCASAADCPQNNMCADGVCIPLPAEPVALAQPQNQPARCATANECAANEICLGGGCVPAPPNPADVAGGQQQQSAQQQGAQAACTDSDGNNKRVKGTTTGIANLNFASAGLVAGQQVTFVDFCDGTTLREGMCRDGKVDMVSYRCERSNEVCGDGACVAR